MQFLNPWFAAAVAAVVIPALLILYFLKLRRREERVPSTLLWKRAVQDLQVNAPFQRLRRNLLLLLQLLILAAAIFALARPIVETTLADAERVVILIDRSASMNAVEADGRTRLDQAKEEAIGLVRTFNRRTSGWRSFFNFAGAPAETQVMVVAFSDRASIVSPFTTNTAELVSLIDAIEPTDGLTDMSEALSLAEAYMAPPTRLSAGMEDTPVPAQAPATLVLVSDGRVAGLDKLVLRGGTLNFLQVGQRKDNVGITSMRAQRNYERPELVNVFMTVANFGPERATTDVSINVDGILRSVQSVSLAPFRRGDTAPGAASRTDAEPGRPPETEPDDGYARSLSFDLQLDTGALVEAKLSRNDALQADNIARVIVPPPRRQRVLVVTDGKYPFLNHVLGGLPLLEYPFVTPAAYEKGAGTTYAVDGQSAYDVVIFDKYMPADAARIPSGNYLCLGVVPPLEELKQGEPIERQPLVWWDETHPVLRHVSLEYIYVARSATVELPAEADVLVEGRRGPVLFRYAKQGRNYLVLTFAVEQSNWVTKMSYPVFMYNAIRYLAGGAEAESGPTRPGTTLRVPAPPDTQRIQLYRPDGSHVGLLPDTYGIAYYGGTERTGVYRADPGVAGRDLFAVNIEDEWESDIAPPETITIGTQGQVERMELMKTATPEVWRWFIGAALAILLFEWWVYNRRVMI